MTRSSEVFRAMSREECEALLEEMREKARGLYRRLEKEAAATLRMRPVFLGKQPFAKRCEMIRRAMALDANAEAASEVLAAFFVECRRADVVELLEGLGLAHEDGVLRELAPAQPEEGKLREVVERFRGGKDAPMRSVLLKAFAAQAAIDWPLLDAMLLGQGASVRVEAERDAQRSRGGARTRTSGATKKRKGRVRT